MKSFCVIRAGIENKTRAARLLRAKADYGKEAAARCALFAVAEQAVYVAGRAEVGDVDVFGAEAGFSQLGLVGFPEVEEDFVGRGLVAGGPHVEPL